VRYEVQRNERGWPSLRPGQAAETEEGTFRGVENPLDFTVRISRLIDNGELPTPPEVMLLIQARGTAITPETAAELRRLGAGLAAMYQRNPALAPPPAQDEPPEGSAVRYHKPGRALATLGGRMVRFCELCGGELRRSPVASDLWVAVSGGASCAGPRTDADSDGSAFSRELGAVHDWRFEADPEGRGVVVFHGNLPAGFMPWVMAAEKAAELGALVSRRLAEEEQRARRDEYEAIAADEEPW